MQHKKRLIPIDNCYSENNCVLSIKKHNCTCTDFLLFNILKKQGAGRVKQHGIETFTFLASSSITLFTEMFTRISA